MSSTEVLWQPSDRFVRQSHLHHFEEWLAENYQQQFSDYESLWAWSAEDPARFWEALWRYFDIIHHSPYEEVMRGDSMPGVQWFPGATLNYAEHIFRHRSDDRPALISVQEGEPPQHISWSLLEQRVVAIRTFLQSKGVGQGDRVAAYLPNISHAIAAFLAVNSLGAIWSCCSPDFGVQTVIDRFSQIEPKVLIAVDGYRYNGKAFDRTTELEQIVGALPSVQELVLIPYLSDQPQFKPAHTLWRYVIGLSDPSSKLSFTPVPFDHPIWVLYSSGTTGKPKAITHSHGGVLLEHLKYLAFHNDTHPGEHFFWFTTTGWMMWNFLQASMLMGAVPILYDGSPGYPSLNALWELSAELPIHHFGTSAPYLTACMKRGLEPGKAFDLSKLRSIGSTGAPLPPEAFDWVYESVGEHIWLCSMSGGTDVCTAFVGGIPNKPVYRGRIQGRALGCAMYAYSESGERLTDSLGEMVIEHPMPSMPIYFWNDQENERYTGSYFADFPGKWRHGDWIHLFNDGSLIIQGRSDATLNRKGVRIGTAEIYSILDGIPELQDSLVLNIELDGGDDHMPLFVVLHDGQELNDGLRDRIKLALRKEGSPRHVPDTIIVVPDIPYTLSGKKMEVPVKKILLGMDAGKSMNKDAVRNPEAIAFFQENANRLLRTN